MKGEDFLATITAKTRERIERHKQTRPLEKLRAGAQGASRRISFAQALRKPACVTLIAELKQASPSAGVIRQEDDARSRIQAYQRGGASALSVLTEPDYFKGSPEILRNVRAWTDLPLLRKDFILDPYQVEESKWLGADAILLIVAMLEPRELRELLKAAGENGLDALVETHDERDLEGALSAGAQVIGVNNRNLRTLEVDPATAERIVPLIPKGPTIVVESGVRDPEQLASIRAWGAHSVLIGETLMRASDPEQAVARFVQGGSVA